MKFVDVDKIIWRQSPFLTVSGLSDPQGELKFDLFVTSADLAEMPPADVVERKKGKWMLINDNRGQHYICNCCGEWKYHQEQNYCGHCGAEMREEENE